MNTYLVPVYYLGEDSIDIDSIPAKSISEAEDRYIESWLEDDSPVPGDWEEFTSMMKENGVIIGELREISEF